MTVKSDLEKAIATEQAALGNYAMYAESTDDPTAKQMFQQMQQDALRHVQMLNNRLNYLNENNQNTNQNDPQIIQTNKQQNDRRS
jgi:rubrerythrin